jgi:hypothetical protein
MRDTDFLVRVVIALVKAKCILEEESRTQIVGIHTSKALPIINELLEEIEEGG